MNIDAQWIALADELPEHDTHCIVGNVNERDPKNPLLGGIWKAAVFVDRQKAMDETHEAMASVDPTFNCMMKPPLKGPQFVFELFGTGNHMDAREFTHWWPIPKPFTEHPK